MQDGEDRPLLHKPDNNNDTENNVSFKHQGGSATCMSSMANLSNTILGTGMLAMPHSVAQGGVIPGLLTICLSGLAAFYGLYLLSRSASRVGRTSSFSALATITMPSLRVLFDLAIALKCFGVGISYLLIIGGLAPKVVLSFASVEAHDIAESGVPHVLLDRRFWITCSILVLAPISFFKSLNALRFISYLSLAAVANFIFVVVFKFFNRSGLDPPGPIEVFHPSTALLTTLPVFVFAFTCAQNLFATHNELINNTQSRMNLVIGTSIGGSGCVYVLVGLLGYLTFGANVAANVLESYHNSLLIAICRTGILIFVLFSYPLQLQPCRASLEKILSYRTPLPAERLQEEEEGHSYLSILADQTTSTTFALLTMGILVTSYLVALQIDSLEIILGIVGSTGSTTISFILPALFFLKLYPTPVTKAERIHRVLAQVLLVFGFTVMIVCLTLNLRAVVRQGS